MPALIVDGYNVLHAPGRYRDVTVRDLATARDRLVGDLASLVGEGLEITVVFDAAANPLADGSPTDAAGVKVVYSPSGVEADAVVEAMAADAARAGSEVVIVTSDTETANAVSGGSVRIVSAAGFLEELDRADSERRDSSAAARRGATIYDRLSDETRATLLRFRGR